MSEASTALGAVADRYREAWLESPARPTPPSTATTATTTASRTPPSTPKPAGEPLAAGRPHEQARPGCMAHARGHAGVAAGERPVLLEAQRARAGDRVMGADGGVLRPGDARQRQRGLEVQVPTRGPDGEVHCPDLCR